MNQKPHSVLDVFIAFTQIAIQSFGGTLGVLQQELIERRRWLTHDEFLEYWTVAQILPGPNLINFSLMFGAEHFSWRGALAALAGLLLIPLLVVLALGISYRMYGNRPEIDGAIKGMSIITGALITANGVRIFTNLKRNPLGIAMCFAFASATFVGVAMFHFPLVEVLICLGVPACVVAYKRMTRE